MKSQNNLFGIAWLAAILRRFLLPPNGSVFDLDSISVWGTAKNHAFLKCTVSSYWLGPATTDGTLLSTGESTDNTLISGPDADGLSTYLWSVPDVQLRRGLNRIVITA